MSLATIRTEIKTVLDAIADIGVVHDYERLATGWDKYLSTFKPAGKEYIRGWTIRRESTQEEFETHEEIVSKYKFKIRGYVSLNDDDASSKTFDDLIETIRDTFRAFITNDLNEKAYMVEPMQVDIVEDRMFGSVLCHYCELSIIIHETKTV